jgi:hypothetical protein
MRVRTLQTLLFLALLLQTSPPATASEPNDVNDLAVVPQVTVSTSATWWDGLRDPNDPNGLIGRVGSGDDIEVGRMGVVVWPMELGFEYVRSTPDDEEVRQVGAYALARDIGSWISGVVDYREALAALPEKAIPEFYAGGFFDVDTRFDGIAYGPCVGVQASLVYAEYRWPSSEGEIASIFDEDPVLIIGGLLEF